MSYFSDKILPVMIAIGFILIICLMVWDRWGKDAWYYMKSTSKAAVKIVPETPAPFKEGQIIFTIDEHRAGVVSNIYRSTVDPEDWLVQVRFPTGIQKHPYLYVWYAPWELFSDEEPTGVQDLQNPPVSEPEE